MIKEFIVKVTDSVVPDGIHRFEEEYAPEQELVRCKDCKHYGKDACSDEASYPPQDDWFCADGERKDDDA